MNFIANELSWLRVGTKDGIL